MPRSPVARVEEGIDESFWCWPRTRASSQADRSALDVWIGVGEGDFEEGSVPGEGGAQLVGGVGDEVPLGLERGLQPAEEVVEGAAELGEFVIGPRGEATMQVGGGDFPGGGVMCPQRRRNFPASHQANGIATTRRSSASTARVGRSGGLKRACGSSVPPLKIRRSCRTRRLVTARTGDHDAERRARNTRG